MSPDRPVAYVLGTFPQPSQTFIAREIRGLRAEGCPPIVFALRRRPPDALEPADREWYREVRFAPFPLSPAVLGANLHWLVRAPGRYRRALGSVVGLPHRPRTMAVRAVWLVWLAAWIARELQRTGGCRQVHAHFALAQTEVAMAVAVFLGCPVSFTAHARDIYATPSALAEKMRAARFVVTCTGYNVEHLRALCPDLPSDHVHLIHHGVEVPPALEGEISRHGHADAPPLILAAGRLIEKKGFDTLVEACALLKARGVPFRCEIVGTGPLKETLRRLAHAHGLADSVGLPGWRQATELAAAMSRAAVFAMPSRVAAGGDRDGIPNVVLEALAVGLPVVATAVSGIPEAVRDDDTGLLVSPDDAESLAQALERVLTDASLARRLSAAGRTLVDEEFTLKVASERLIRLFANQRP